MSQPQSNGLLERLFHLSEHNTTVRRECLAGLTTFVSMAYILFVNPIILGDAGMDPGAVFTATALSAIMGCLLMGFLANYPIAIAPGLGDNAFFTYSIVLAMGMPWQQAMGGVFIASILFTLVSLFKLREIIIDAIPQDLKYAMAAGIGIFISFVGLQGGGIVMADPSSMVAIGSFKVATTWLTIFGIFVTAMLMAKKVPGAIFYGIVLTAVLGLVTNLIPLPDSIISMAPSLEPTFGVGVANMGAIVTDRRCGRRRHLLPGRLLRYGRNPDWSCSAGRHHAKRQDAPHRESPYGRFPFHARRGRHGNDTDRSLRRIVGRYRRRCPDGPYGHCRRHSLWLQHDFLAPLVRRYGSGYGTGLIIIGVLMTSSLREIHWDQFETAFPAFLVIIGMPLTFNISYGIAFGFLFYRF